MKTVEYPSSGEWINKIWQIHTMEYYLAIKRNKILLHATTWINLENIVLGERSQSLKTIYYIYYVIPFLRNRQIHRERK